MEQPVPHVLFVAVTGDRAEMSTQCSIGLLKLQSQIARTAQLELHFAETLEDALVMFADKKEATTLVAMDGRVGFPPDFVMHALAPEAPEFVVGVFPLPVTDWARVEKRIQTPSQGAEPLATVGYTYNVTPKTALARYAEVDRTKKLTIKALALSRSAFDTFYTAFHKGKFLQASTLKPRKIDDLLSALYPGTIYADLDAQCMLTGPAEFAGCVGTRRVALR